jgi:hypothetical protein
MSFIKNKSKSITNSIKGLFKKGAKPSTADSVALNQPEKIAKPKFRHKVIDYVKLVINDYKEVGKDSIKYMNENPFKSIGYGLTLGFCTLFYKRKPTRQDYNDRRLIYLNDMIMCGSVYNKKSEYYLNEVSRLENSELLEYKSCFLFSLMLVRPFSEKDCTFESHCGELVNPSKYNIFNSLNQTLRYLSRILDIGFNGSWIFLEKRMINYDVDDGEWKEAKK